MSIWALVITTPLPTLKLSMISLPDFHHNLGLHPLLDVCKIHLNRINKQKGVLRWLIHVSIVLFRSQMTEAADEALYLPIVIERLHLVIV